MNFLRQKSWLQIWSSVFHTSFRDEAPSLNLLTSRSRPCRTGNKGIFIPSLFHSALCRPAQFQDMVPCIFSWIDFIKGHANLYKAIEKWKLMKRPCVKSCVQVEWTEVLRKAPKTEVSQMSLASSLSSGEGCYGVSQDTESVRMQASNGINVFKAGSSGGEN